MKKHLYILIVVLIVISQYGYSQLVYPEAGQSTYIITSGQTIIVTDGQSIVFGPGTHIQPGATFTAKIGEITSANDAYTSVTFSNENYVFTRSFQTAMTSFNPNTAEEGDVIESIVYYDGLGRPMQQVGIKFAPDKKDIIAHIGYDDYGRQDKDWLPYHESTGVNGTYRGDVSNQTKQYYQTHYGTDFTGLALIDINAYSQKDIEASPLNRILKQASPGKDWKLGQGHEIEFSYQTNILNEVKHYEVSLSLVDGIYIPQLVEDGYYLENELYKTVTEDENYDETLSTKAHTTEDFKDKQGRVVLKRTYGTSVVNGVSQVNIEHDTYYVYDDYGNLSYVLPPKVNLNDGVSPEELSELCYQYKYDYRNRLVEKKIPGKDWEYVIYDNLDRPVLIQDANLRADNKWLFTKYDALGRVIYTGFFATTQTVINLRNTFKNKLLATDNYETKVTTGTGYNNSYYTNTDFPNTSLELLTINYYDNYYFDKEGLALPATADGVSIINYNDANKTLTKSLTTGSKVAVLDTNPVKWITTITGYDDKGRSIYAASNNSYLETTGVVINSLDFAGKTIKTTTSHNKTGHIEITTQDQLSYDHEGRLLKQKQTINNLSQEVIAENNYDNLGQLVSKGVGGKASAANRLQTVDYTYNVRGWLKQINDVSSLGTDLFSFKIDYNNPSVGSPLYNGNISQTNWKTSNSDNSTKAYWYEYDALNRITKATDNTSKFSLASISYDKNGNIMSLHRKGHIVDNPILSNASHYGSMDNLVYTYQTSSNKLLKVTDNLSNDKYGFKDDAVNFASDSSDDYTYDANGNMLTDENKGILSNITYNHLDLPTNVALDGGNISYIYDATGVKLEKTISTGTTTEYAGNYVYVDTGSGSSLKFFNHPEGYVEPKNVNDLSQGFNYIYQYKDHLGNVRLSYSDADGNGSINASTEILEENNYYPFGLRHKGYNFNVASTNIALKRKFGGMEYQDELGLDTYDFGARNYDAALGRWMKIDPLAEFMRNQSPYNYGFNNPIYFSDYEGDIPWPVPEMFRNWMRRLGSPFGPRTRNGRTRNHNGVDINFSGGGNTDLGAPVVATHSGRVSRIHSTNDGGAGRYIEIESPDGSFMTRYLHLSSIAVEEGDEINEGQTIGLLGGSGFGSDLGYTAHLHYEIHRNGTAINPVGADGNLIDPQQWVGPQPPSIPDFGSTATDWIFWEIGMNIWFAELEEFNAAQNAANRTTATTVSSLTPAPITPIPSQTPIVPVLPPVPNPTPNPAPNPTPNPPSITPPPDCIDC